MCVLQNEHTWPWNQPITKDDCHGTTQHFFLRLFNTLETQKLLLFRPISIVSIASTACQTKLRVDDGYNNGKKDG